MKPKKAKPTRIRPFAGDKEIAEKISDNTGLDVIVVMSFAMHAGLKALEENNYRMDMPFKFNLIPTPKSKEPPAKAGQMREPPGESLAFAAEAAPKYQAK